MAITAQQVKELREETSLAMMACKRALEEAGGDKEKAKELLRKQGHALAQKKAGRATTEGAVGSYIHFNGRVGVLIELACETDFVAASDVFQSLLTNIAMQIAMNAPQHISREEVPAELVEKEKEILAAQPRNKKIPEGRREKAILGQIEKNFFGLICLLDQPYIKDEKLTVGELIRAAVAQTGENIRVKRFARFALGED